jgi:putative endonuclease
MKTKTRTARTVTGYETGLKAERLARLALMVKGYRILACRYKTPLGEIDLVARRGRTLCFVEVKRRGTQREGAEAIHAKNQERVARAAALYLQRHPEYSGMDIRFDAVVVSPRSWPRHIPRAWE